MVKKIAKTALFASVLATVLSAGTVSALQLHKNAQLIGFCRGTCSATVHCSGPCFCWIPDGATSGGCVKDPPGLKPQAK
jgi:hypothetical protein